MVWKKQNKTDCNGLKNIIQVSQVFIQERETFLVMLHIEKRCLHDLNKSVRLVGNYN